MFESADVDLKDEYHPGTLLPPGPTMTDPQPPEGTTRTPETSKGGIHYFWRNGLESF